MNTSQVSESQTMMDVLNVIFDDYLAEIQNLKEEQTSLIEDYKNKLASKKETLPNPA